MISFKISKITQNLDKEGVFNTENLIERRHERIE